MLGAAHVATAAAVAVDFDEAPRVADHALSGALLPDMGAYERNPYRLETTGALRPGGVVTFTLRGPSGVGSLLLGYLDGTTFVPPFGIVLEGTSRLHTLSPTLSMDQA